MSQEHLKKNPGDPSLPGKNQSVRMGEMKLILLLELSLLIVGMIFSFLFTIQIMKRSESEFKSKLPDIRYALMYTTML